MKFRIKKLLFFVLICFSDTAHAQNLSAYTDYRNYFYVFDLLNYRCNCISRKNRRKRGKKKLFWGKKSFVKNFTNNYESGIIPPSSITSNQVLG